MPLYMTNTKAGAIDDAARKKIATDITRIHCDVTGSLPAFVNAFFFEDAAHMSLGGKTVSILGGIRAGRNDAQQTQIVSEIQESVRLHTGLALDSIDVTLQSTPASWVMEGGAIMPEPGDEAAWLAAHAARANAAAS